MKLKAHTGMGVKWISACIVLIMVITGCSAGNTTDNTNTEGMGNGNTDASAGAESGGSEQNEPITITMLNTFLSETAPKDDGPVVSAMEEITGVNLEMTWVPNNVFDEKLNVTLASGELPQVILADPLNSNIINGIESGMFWELDPYLADFPNLQTFNPIAIENSQYKGKTYALLRPRPVARGGVILRKDWLDNVGMELPSTIDDLYDLIVAFKEKDPDGNGQDDTYGLMQYGGFNRDIMAWFGAPNGWKVEDGKFIKDVETSEYREGLQFLRKLYEEKLINPNFAIEERNVARKDLYTNKVGMDIGAFDAVVPFYNIQMAQFSDNFEFTVAAPLENSSYGGQGYLLGFLIPKSSVETEEELKQVLAFFEAQRHPDGVEQFRKLLQDNSAKPQEEQFNVDNLRQFLVNDVLVYPLGDTPTDQMIRERMDANNEVAVGNPAFKLISPTQTERGGELDTILEDAAIQFILGEIDEEGFEAAVEQWKDAGGSKVAEEYAELHTP